LFRKGSDLYFDRFDGMAVTTNDFVACMEEVSGQDFTQFKRWYTQAGTPEISVRESFNAVTSEYKLTFEQTCKATPGQTEKLPFVIPVKMALLDDQGKELSLDCDGAFNQATQVLTLTEQETSVSFKGIAAKPVPSLFRDFSAPVRVQMDLSEHDLLVLAKSDGNTFNRFDAVQSIYLDSLLQLAKGSIEAAPALVDAVISSVLSDTSISYAVKASLLTLPAYQLLMDNITPIDAGALIKARELLKKHLATKYASSWAELTHQLASAEQYTFNSDEAGRRELQGLALNYWTLSGDDNAVNYAEALYRAAQNQTDRLNGLRAALESEDINRKNAILAHFYRHWHEDTQMIETWFSLQAGAEGTSVASIKELMAHEAFDMTNPNKVRSVLGAFATNFKTFHDEAGEGYAFLTQKISELNAINPQVAARFVSFLQNWKKFTPERSEKMKKALSSVISTEDLSPDVLEMVQKALA